MGSYQAQIEPDEQKPNIYSITIIDAKGWASATRRPVFMRKLLNMGERQSVYLNEHRDEYPEHRGGMMVLHFEFEVEEDPCATCDLDFDLEQAIRQNSTL